MAEGVDPDSLPFSSAVWQAYTSPRGIIVYNPLTSIVHMKVFEFFAGNPCHLVHVTADPLRDFLIGYPQTERESLCGIHL